MAVPEGAACRGEVRIQFPRQAEKLTVEASMLGCEAEGLGGGTCSVWKLEGWGSLSDARHCLMCGSSEAAVGSRSPPAGRASARPRPQD